MAIASTVWERFRGVDTGVSRVLLRTGAIHGRGLDQPLIVVGLTSFGVVAARRRLDPGKFVRIRGAQWILELPAGEAVPEVGGQLRIYARPCDWETVSVCNSDRQPCRLI